MKKVISIILAVYLMLSALPMPAMASNQSDVVANTIVNYIASNHKSFNSSYGGKAWGCWAFCNYVWKGVFGKDYFANTHRGASSGTETSDIYGFLTKNNAKVGDILWCGTPDFGTSHSMIILSYDSEGLWLSDGTERGTLWHNNARITYNDEVYARYFGGHCRLALYKVNDGYWSAVANGSAPAPSSPTNAPSKPSAPTAKPQLSTVSMESGNWNVYIPANYKLLLYSSETSTTSVNYCSARSPSYRVVCSKKATLSNGAIRYYGVFNTDDHYWLTYAGGMTLEHNSETPLPVLTADIKSGQWIVEIPVNSRIKLYNNADSTSSSSVYTTSGPYKTQDFLCNQQASLSDGSVRYATGFFENNTLVTRWFTLTDAMSAKEQNSLPTYTVSLDANGGSVSPSSITVKQNGTYNSLPQARWSQNDYRFDGWYTSAVGGTEVTSSSRLAVNADHTLYAHWVNPYEFTLDPNGGTVLGSSSPITEKYQNSEYLPAATRPGYTFDGWYTERNGGTKLSQWVITSGGRTVYAHWTPIAVGNYTVTFDCCGGASSTLTFTSLEVQAGGTYSKLPYVFGSTFGSELVGWFTAPTGGTQVKVNDPLVTNGDHTLYAHYVKKLYTITFDPNGGTVARQHAEGMSSSPQEYIVGANAPGYGELPKAAWDGREFLGWFTAPVGGTQAVKGTHYVVQDDHTLYAHWK